MKRYVPLFLILFLTQASWGQLPVPEPDTGPAEGLTRWAHSVVKLDSLTYDLVYEARIERGWVLYSSYSARGGSLPAEFVYPDKGVELLGEVREGKTYQKYQEVFGVTETFFKDKAQFEQRIRITDSIPGTFEVYLSYQVCEKELCIPLEETFVFELKRSEGSFSLRAISTTRGIEPLEEDSPVVTGGEVPEYFLLTLEDRALLNAELSGAEPGLQWDVFFKGLLGGLIAVFTPCVLPLIPLTVNFFSKRSDPGSSPGRSGGLWYGFFIVAIYLLLSLPFHLVSGIDPQILNNLATNIWTNLIFFVVFLLFALSFFGWFEFRLPSSWGAGADRASETLKGPLGVFFMALTLVIVSFSCTGPILGLLLGSTALTSGDVAGNLTLGMAGFGFGLALPFSLFSLFPGWLGRFPRSGGWMEFVKITLAFLELALAIKFLSNADLVGNWNLLKREVVMISWMLIVLGYGLYILGLLNFSDYRFRPESWRWRVPLLSMLVFSLLYLGFGIFDASKVKSLSGLLPPDFYSLRSQPEECPLGLNCHKDFEQGWVEAMESGKPMLLDFTGWACANCRQMEQDVWSRPQIYSLLRDEVILVSLYTDDRTRLPEEERFLVRLPSGLEKPVRTIGQKWGAFQLLNFGAISQPYYVLISPDLRVLAPATQSSSAAEYLEWLDNGLQRLREID